MISFGALPPLTSLDDSDAYGEMIPRLSAQEEREAFLALALDASRMSVEGDKFLFDWVSDVFWRDDCGTKALVETMPKISRRDVIGDFIILIRWKISALWFVYGSASRRAAVYCG